MSHFTVLVITESAEDVEKALQPFHEYECTGIEDEHVIDVDKTEEVNEWLARQLFVGVNKNSGKEDYEYRAENAEKNLEAGYKTMTQQEYIAAQGKDLDAEIADYHGFEKKNGVWTRYTNPNAQWDWWTIGGRWSGLLRVKPGAEAVKGRPGLMGSEYSADGVDQCRLGDLDMEAMLAESRKNIEEGRRETFAKIVERAKEDASLSWVLETDGFEKWDLLSAQAGDAEKYLRSLWETQGKPGSFSDFIDSEKAEGCPRATTLRLAGSVGYGSMFGITPGKTLQQALDSAVALSTFAVLKDGKWYERGSMGWWCMVADEKDSDAWQQEIQKLLEGLPPETVITVVDCHI